MGISLSGSFPQLQASTPNTFSTQTRYCYTCYNGFTLPALELPPQARKQFATVSSYIIIEQNMCIYLPHQAHLNGLRRHFSDTVELTRLLYSGFRFLCQLINDQLQGFTLKSCPHRLNKQTLLKGFFFSKIRHSRVFFKKGMLFCNWVVTSQSGSQRLTYRLPHLLFDGGPNRWKQ